MTGNNVNCENILNSVQNITQSEIICVPCITWNETDIQEIQGIYNSWGLSGSTLDFLKMYGMNSIEVLEKMQAEDVEKLFAYVNSAGFFGERVKFMAGLRQWRQDRNIPLLSDQPTQSPPSTQKVLEWLEKISNDLNSYNSSNSRVSELTLSIKASLRFSYCALVNNFFQPEFIYNKLEAINVESEIYFSSISAKINALETYKRTSYIIFRGKTFKKEHIVTVTKDDMCNIYEIIDFLVKDNDAKIVVKHWKNLYFSEHFQAHVVGNGSPSYTTVEFSSLDGPPIHFYLLNNGLKVIRQKRYWK